jgi:lambda repressor-like predicted transcriptional regulator
MRTTVNLENKDVREIIAKFLGIKVEQVIPQRYTFGIEGMSAEEITQRIYGQKRATS